MQHARLHCGCNLEHAVSHVNVSSRYTTKCAAAIALTSVRSSDRIANEPNDRSIPLQVRLQQCFVVAKTSHVERFQ